MLQHLRAPSLGFTTPEVGDTWRLRNRQEVGVTETVYGGVLVLHDGTLRDKYGRHDEDRSLDLVKLVGRGNLREVRTKGKK